MIFNAGGLYGDIGEQTPLKSYNFYVDFTGLLLKFIDYCEENKILETNAEMREETEEEIYGKNEKGEMYTDGARMVNNNSLLKNASFYNLARDNNLRSALDFGFYVGNINIPKYTMKTTKINYMDKVQYRPLKTSYGGELNLSIKSTFQNITKLSLLLGFFELYDTYDMWGKVYTFNGRTSYDRGNGRGMDAISEKMEVGSPNIDISVVDDKLNDSVVYRVVNPIITNVDFGSFSYGTNAINEIKMAINYNSWYLIDGNVRNRDNGLPETTNDIKVYNKLKSELDKIFNKMGKTFEKWQENANDFGSELPWGEDRSDKNGDGVNGRSH